MTITLGQIKLPQHLLAWPLSKMASSKVVLSPTIVVGDNDIVKHKTWGKM